MMYSFRALLLATLFATAVPTIAAAATINFSSLSEPGFSSHSFGPSLTFGGFTFTSSSGSVTLGLHVWQPSAENHPIGGDAATSLLEYLAGSTTTMTRAAGGSFDLNGIDLANWGVSSGGFPATFDVSFTGTKSDSTPISQTFTVANVAGSPQLQSFVFSGFTDVVNVKMTQGVYASGTAFQFNNLVVDGAVSAPVPEPGSTLTLMVAGLITIACLRLTRS
jgi:hypothetical protein